jgi:Ferritin-like
MAQGITLIEGGRLANVLATRGGERGPEGPLILEHREALIYMLDQAAELEHLIMCEYLFAVFSLKQSVDEGLTEEQLERVKRWRRTITGIATQEMLHLALVQNLLTAVGASPHLSRPNLPQPARHYPAGVQIALLPFGERALRHFVFLERPQGMEMADAEGFAALELARPVMDPEGIVPHGQDFSTVGHLYRSIADGLTHLAKRYGERGLFIGPLDAQATAEHFRWPELVPVVDLASAQRAIGTIVEQGEGASGDWHEAHFGRLVSILEEFQALRVDDPTFEPARPVLPCNVRPPETGDVPIATDAFTVRCIDLMNVANEVLLQLLYRYFAHTQETPEQLGLLADVAVGVMFEVLRPLGSVITRLPVGPDYPGFTAGPSFELFYETGYFLPHREAAWVLIRERMREAADFATRCHDHCVPLFMPTMGKVAAALTRFAEALEAAG